MTHLVDTNVLSELFRPEPDEGARRWARGIQSINLSAITVEELWYGLTRHRNPRLLERIESFVLERCEILPVSRQIGHQSGILRAHLASKGRTTSQADTLIAATAIVHGLTLVTRNIRHFESCPVTLLDPFSR